MTAAPGQLFLERPGRIGDHVGLHLQAIDQLVELVVQANDGEQLAVRFRIEPELLQRRRVRIDAVTAAIGNGHGQGNHLLRAHVQLARAHDRLQELLDRQDQDGKLSPRERREAGALVKLADISYSTASTISLE